MIRRPPRSTPFPTRRSSDLKDQKIHGRRKYISQRGRPQVRAHDQRSEEHTSELQSLRHLVCRLLLEKKKKNNTQFKIADTESIPSKTSTRRTIQSVPQDRNP